MDRKNDSSPKRRVNFSITEETQKLLKNQAEKEGTTMSELISRWIWKAEHENDQVRISREWVNELNVETLERLLLYCEQNHFISPAQAVTNLIWKAKVNGASIPGQMSLRT